MRQQTKQQLDAHKAFALAMLAASFRDVEREAAGIVSPRLRHFRRSEQLAYVIEQSGVCCEVRARRASDRFLIDLHESLDGFYSCGDLAFGGNWCGAFELVAFVVERLDGMTECFGDELDERLAHQARLAGAGYACHRSEQTYRERDFEILQVVARNTAQCEP